MERIFLLLAGILVLSAASGFAEEYPLVKAGQAKCAVIQGRNAGATEQLAAQELQAYLKKISGVEVLISGQNAGLYAIHLGLPENCPAIREFGLEEKVKGLSNDGFVIKADNRGMVIAAKKPIGVLYGVYTFLEEYLGLRWYYPGEDGEFCPQQATINIPAIDDVQNPACAIRSMVSYGENPYFEYGCAWARRNKCSMNADHSMPPQLPPFAEHPEYYALLKGQRKAGQTFCTSNTSVIDLAARDIISFFKKGPDVHTIIFGDAENWCECPACRAQDDPRDVTSCIFAPVSTRAIKFVNGVTERVLKECPGKEIRYWAYQGYLYPPHGARPDPRLKILVAIAYRCYRHALNDPACLANVTTCKLLKEWKALAPENTIGLFEYYSDVMRDYNVPFDDIMAEDVKYEAGIGLQGMLCGIFPAESRKDFPLVSLEGAWRARILQQYILAKALWNPRLDVAKLKADFFQHYYGPAAAQMQAYRELLNNAWRQADGHVVCSQTCSADLGRCLSKPGVEDELRRKLDAAAKAAEGNAVVQKRIAFEKDCFEQIWHKARVDFKQVMEKATSQKQAKATKLAGKITVDGVLDEPDWKNAGTVTNFMTEKPDAPQSSAKVLYDNECVYFGIECMAPNPEKLAHMCDKRDDVNVTADDDVELFIDPQGDLTYYHICVNPNGTVYDAYCRSGIFDKNFNFDGENGGQAASKILKDRWVMEIRIKASALKAKIAEGGAWKVAVCRVSPQYGSSTWCDESPFHKPALFRVLVFEPVSK
jgi:hypothetical protein